jgi:uncharacterized repeat protein (TIGR01451 family)
MPSHRNRFLISLLLICALVQAAEAQPIINATMTDVLVVDIDGDNEVDPGDTVRYIIDVTNTGNMNADNASLTDTIDANTTLVPGSTNTTPIARNDTYMATGNVSISVPANGVLGNDNDPDGGTVTAVAIVAGTSVNGGDVDLAVDGSFTYNPPPGFEGVDSFSYTAMDDEGQTDTATVAINVSDMIWFIDAGATCPCDGRLSNPFDNLAVTANSFDVNAADDAGDSIFLADGSYNGGLALQSNQLLIGDGSSSDLATITGITLPANSAPLPVFSGVDPVITSTANGINLATGNTVRGLTVGDTASGIGIADNGSVGTLTITEATISGAGGGIELDSGGTLAVSFDSLSASSSSNEGINLLGVNGSFSVSGGSIGTSTVPAVNIDGNPSLALTVSLGSVSADGGANGIDIRDTTGSFTVTGSGGACTMITPTCSGGRIQNMTGANGSTDGNGIYLSNTQSISLSLMRVDDHQNHAVRGSSVTGFSLTDSYVHGPNGNSDTDDEGSIRFTNLLGSATISGSDISGGLEDNVRINNSSGTLDRLMITGTTIGANDTTLGNDGILVEATSTAVVKVTVDNNTFTSSRADLLQLIAADTSATDWVVTNNTFSNNHPNIVSGGGGVTLAGGDNSTATYDVSDNTMRDAVGHALNVFMGTGGSADWDGIIDNNDIGVSGVADSGSEQAHGINVEAQGAGSHTTAVTNNDIFQFFDRGIALFAIDGAGSMDATVTGNTLAEPADDFTQQAIYAQAGATSGDTHLLCADITGNTFAGAGGMFSDDFRLRQRFTTTINLPGYAGASGDTAAVVTFVQGNNVGVPTGSATVDGAGFTGAGMGCTEPVIPMAAGDPLLMHGSDAQIPSIEPSFVALAAETVFGASAEVRSLAVAGGAAPAGAEPPLSGETLMQPLGHLNPGQQVTIQFDVTIDSPFPAGVSQVCNQGLISGENFPAELTDDPDTPAPDDPTCTPIAQPEADLSITKTDDADPIVAGNTLVYTVSINNAGPEDATNVVVTDTLPAGVTFDSTNGCAEDPGGLPTCSLGTIPAGGSAMFTIEVTVDPGTVGVITNQASVTSDAGDPNPGNNSTMEDTTVEPPRADLSITKIDDVDPVVSGNTLIYTLMVDNAGPQDAPNVVVTDSLPAGVTFVSTLGCDNDPNGVPGCSLGTIPAMTGAQFTIEVIVDQGTVGVITNNASVASDIEDPNTDDNSTFEDTEVILEADLSISKTDSDDPVIAGNQITYTVTVDNAGPAPAENVVVTDTLPLGVTFVSTMGCPEDPNGVPTCSLGTIPADGSAFYTVTVTVDSNVPHGDILTNDVSVTSSTPDPDDLNNSISEMTTVNRESNLSVAKSDDVDPVIAGNQLVYTVTVDNAGPSVADNVTVTDTLPAGATLVSTDGCGNDPNGVPTCNLGTIPAGDSAFYTVTVNIDPGVAHDTTINNSVTAASASDDPDESDNMADEDTLVNRESDMTVSKTDNLTAPVVAGTQMTYTITVLNQGPSEADNVVVEDTLPAGVNYVSDTDSCVEGPPGLLTCSLGTIAPDTHVPTQFDITVLVASGEAEGATLTNNVSVSSDSDDLDDDNNDSSEDSTVTREVDIEVTKIDSIDPVVAGSGADNLSYTVTVTNNGPSDASNVEISDSVSLPHSGVTVTGSSATQGGIAGTSPLVWDVGILTAGQTETMTVDLSVTLHAPEGPDVISNFAEVTGVTEPDTDDGNDDATEGTSVRWPTATWRVVKEYTEGGSGGVQVQLQCSDNTGLAFGDPDSGTTTASLTWRRFDIDPAVTSCTVIETVPDGFYEFSRSAECDVDPVADQGSYVCTITNAPTRATFHVVKGFDDDNPSPVAVTVSCDTGLPLEQTKMIVDDNDPNGGVDFVVVDFTTGTLDCEITEEEVPGYLPWYTNRSVGSEGRDDGCFYSDVVGGADHSCFIRNDLQQVRIDVTKRWIDDNPQFNNPTYAKADWNCYNVQLDDRGFFGCHGDDCGTLHFYGTVSTDSFHVFPDWDGSTYCSVEERVFESGVESSGNCGRVYVMPGQGNACTITNTRFYEGIPTLSQYGLAILALLMLGVGMLGFRRFV